MNNQIKDIINGQIITYCEQVNTGTKLVAQITFHNDYLGYVKDKIKLEECNVIFRKANDEMKVALIYKYEFVKILLKESLLMNNESPKAIDIYIAGKLFGYSDYEIAKYLEGHGYIKNAI